MGGKTELDRVVAYVPAALKQELEHWAADEERSVSWLVAKLLDRAVQERRGRAASSAAERLLTFPQDTAIEKTG